MTSSPSSPADDPADPGGVARLFRQQTVGMVSLDADGRITAANEVAVELLGLPADRLVGAVAISLIESDDLRSGQYRKLLAHQIDSIDITFSIRGELAGRRLRAAVVAMPGDPPDRRAAIVMLPPQHSSQDARDALSHLTNLDPLTQLVNRRPLLQALSAHLRESGASMAVVALNIDRFAAVNDSMGQAIGDRVLTQLAGRVRSLLQGDDMAARLGGDDFAVLFHDVSTRAHGAALVERLLDRIAEPIAIEGLTIKLSASAGITLVDRLRVDTADQALMHATAALNTAKRNGRARWEFFDKDMAAQTTNRLDIETSLRKALGAEQLTVAYQPIRDLEGGHLSGAEALIRWADPRLGSVAPETFVPIAQDSGLAEPLTAFVLDHAVRDAAAWRIASDADVHVAVNLTAQDLSRRQLPQEVTTLLGRHGLPPRALQLEIVETVLVDADPRILRNMADLRELGVGLGIDDFGTGYSSMTYLKNMPVDFVKIDKSFVTGLGTEREDTAIVRAVIGLAKSLDLTVIAEGIETPTQMRILVELGCDKGQGYLIGHAEPSEVVAAMFTSS